MKQLGLLIRLIIGIIAGTIIGLSGGWLGIADSTGFIAVIRAFATFTSLFSTFLSFMIPLIILAFVTVGMAELGKKANRLFLLTLGWLTARRFSPAFSPSSSARQRCPR